MASISDAMYFNHPYQMIGDRNRPMEMPVMVYSNRPGDQGPLGAATEPSPEGMEQMNVWSSWKTGGSDRVPANYPCSNDGQICPGSSNSDGSGLGQTCGRSMILRENSVLPGVVGSADGTGYLTTNWLPPHVQSTRLGFCMVSRKPVAPLKPDSTGKFYAVGGGDIAKAQFVQDEKGTVYSTPKNGTDAAVSQLFLDDQPLLRWETGLPFLFKSEQTPFIYMVPNALWVKTGGAKYRVDTMSALQANIECDDCLGY